MLVASFSFQANDKLVHDSSVTCIRMRLLDGANLRKAHDSVDTRALDENTHHASLSKAQS